MTCARPSAAAAEHLAAIDMPTKQLAPDLRGWLVAEAIDGADLALTPDGRALAFRRPRRRRRGAWLPVQDHREIAAILHGAADLEYNGGPLA